jgi:hypothetical protein
MQGIESERCDRAALGSAWSRGSFGLRSGGGWRAGWRGWAARHAAYAPSQLGRSPADIGDQRHGGRGRVRGTLPDGVLGGHMSSAGCWLGARGGGEGV